MSVEQGSFNRERALLFFDDQYLDRRDNLDRRLGQPVPVPEGTWRDPDLDPSWGYPSVFADRESGLWRCLYQAQLPRSFVPEGRRCRDCPNFEIGVVQVCSGCGSRSLFKIGVVNELVEMLHLTGAEVDFAEPIETLREAGEIAALLRY